MDYYHSKQVNKKAHMYTQLWNKYLPVIKILVKRSGAEEQTLDVNQTDFEHIGKVHKTSPYFNIAFTNGRTANNDNVTELAKALINILINDDLFKNLLLVNNYKFSFNKFQLRIKNCELDSDRDE